MNELSPILEQCRLFFVQHAPADMLTRAVPAGLVLLVAGIGLSVLGAKLARFGITAVAVLVGGAAGLLFARGNGFHPVLGVLIGAFLIGLIGYQTFKVWVGVGTALVLVAIVAGVYGQKQILPHVKDFEPTPLAASDGTTAFTLPTPEAQQANMEGNPKQWLKDFWGHVSQHDARAATNARAIAIVALLSGLSLGLIFTRWALILSTSIIGTMLVAAGAAALLVRSVPDSCAAFQKNPGLAAAGIAGFLITSLILQMLLSRKGEEETEK